MSKKFLTILGIILLLTAFGLGIYAFIQRHENNELFKNPTSSKAKQTKFNFKKYSIHDPASPWVVVNKTRPLNPKNYAPTDLVGVGNNQTLREQASEALKRLIDGAKTDGLILDVISGYRSYDAQITVYDNEVKSFGQSVADSESARPGYSEHQTGLAVDVGGGGCGIEDCFGTTPEGVWLSARAYKYGFIVRYTEAKQAITGYRAEPWHIRFIGTELSQEMHNKNILTLEEFFSLPAAPQYL